MKISTEIYTQKVEECEHFYTKYFRFKVKLRVDGFVILQSITNPEYELMFCIPDSPFVHKVFHPEFNGKGAILQFEVENVNNEYRRLKSLGLETVVDLVTEEINGTHFAVKDPSGLLIDIVSY